MMRLEKFQWISLSVLISILITAFLAFYVLFLNHIPNYVYDATRYAFVTDKESQNLAIVDLLSAEQIDNQQLQIIPDIFTIDTINPIMAYANFEKKSLYFYDMRKQKNVEINLPDKPLALFFIPNRRNLVVVMQHTIMLANYEKALLYPLTDIPKDANLTQDNLPVFSAIDAHLWLSSKVKPVVYRLKVGDSNPQWQSITMDNLSTPSSHLAVNPQGYILAFAADDVKLAAARLGEKPNLRLGKISSPISSSPFINANNRFIIYGRADGSVDLYHLHNSQRNFVNEQLSNQKVIKILGGWLNQLSVVLAEDQFTIVNNIPFIVKAKFQLNNRANDMWVTGDGQTALVTTEDKSPMLLRFDLRTATQQKPIQLKNITRAHFVRMGGNNSFCY